MFPVADCERLSHIHWSACVLRNLENWTFGSAIFLVWRWKTSAKHGASTKNRLGVHACRIIHRLSREEHYIPKVSNWKIWGNILNKNLNIISDIWSILLKCKQVRFLLFCFAAKEVIFSNTPSPQNIISLFWCKYKRLVRSRQRQRQDCESYI